MAKWNKVTFISCTKENCEPRVQTTVMDLVKFAERDADQISWGQGEGYGTMTFKCKSDDYGIVPLFHITTNGQIKFQLNYLRQKGVRMDSEAPESSYRIRFPKGKDRKTPKKNPFGFCGLNSLFDFSPAKINPFINRI